MTSIEIDLRVGGRWRYAMVTDDGVEVAFLGEYREIVPEERIVLSSRLAASSTEHSRRSLELTPVAITIFGGAIDPARLPSH